MSTSAVTTPANRNTQLDGWRAIAVLGVLWLHWTPDSWRGGFPFAIGLFYLLCLTGFLITRILLREKAMGGGQRGGWQLEAYRRFEKRRALRILAPCLVAMALSYALGAPDLRAHPWLYLGQISNFHLACIPEHPSGSAHYWTLAIQQQIYLFWPMLILWTPRRFLLAALIAAAAVGPVSRAIAFQYPQIIYPGLLTPCALDYFAIGGLLAYAMERGLRPGDQRLAWIAWSALPPYILLFLSNRHDPPIAGARHIQQTLLAVVFTGLISGTLAGFQGLLGRVLQHRAIQHIAKISYNLYLFHGPAPLLAGHLAPILWREESATMIALRIVLFFLVSWGLAWLSWRWIEQPLERMKARLPAEAPLPKSSGGFS